MKENSSPGDKLKNNWDTAKENDKKDLWTQSVLILTVCHLSWVSLGKAIIRLFETEIPEIKANFFFVKKNSISRNKWAIIRIGIFSIRIESFLFNNIGNFSYWKSFHSCWSHNKDFPKHQWLGEMFKFNVMLSDLSTFLLWTSKKSQTKTFK